METKTIKPKKGPVSADDKALIEKLYVNGATEQQLCEQFERSPHVIAKVLQEIALRPKAAGRPIKGVAEFAFGKIKIQTPNGFEFDLALPVGMDATNNSAVVEQIQRFLTTNQAPTAIADQIRPEEVGQ